MRERVTFLHDPAQADFEPKKQLRVTQKILALSALHAGREDQLTLNVEELPQEVWLALKQCQTLAIRWAGPQPYEAIAPFSSRVSPGLHIFLTPKESIDDVTSLCPALQKIFGETVRCTSPARTFTAMPKLSERFAPSASYSFYSQLDSLGELGMYFLQRVCSGLGETCLDRASAVASAASLDVDWKSDARKLIVTAYRDHPDKSSVWDATFSAPPKSTRLEVGVLAREAPTISDPENLALGGLLTVVGRDTEPDQVLFTFPSRHHDAPGLASKSGSGSGVSSYSMSFPSPSGLHPTMRLSFASTSAPASSSHCALHAHLTLPSFLFPDKYQLSAPLFLASNNLRNVRAVWGETDLEAPDWAVSRWGSQMVLELAPPTTAASESWHADVPLHLRYLAPNAAGHTAVQVPWPVLFWACRGAAGTNFSENPFDRVALGYDGFFAPNTLFYHLRPNTTTTLTSELDVPVLNTSRVTSLELITAAVIIGGVARVLWKLLARETPRAGTSTKGAGEKKKQ